MRFVSIGLASLLGGLVLVQGCSSDPPAAKEVGLSIKVGAPGAALNVAGVGSRRAALSLPDGIELSRVRFILREVELHNDLEDEDNSGPGSGDDDGEDNSGPGSDDDGEDSDDSGSDGDEDEIEFGPFLVDLDPAALSGEVIEHVVVATVPQGTYTKLEFKIDTIAPRAGQGPALGDLTNAGLSVLVEGSIDGEDFTLQSSVEAESESAVNIVVGDAGGLENLTLFIDADIWFVNRETGARLDPRVAADAALIEQNIKNSIDADDDDDADGIGDDDDDDDNRGHDGDDDDCDDDDDDDGDDDDGDDDDGDDDDGDDDDCDDDDLADDGGVEDDDGGEDEDDGGNSGPG